MMKRLCVIFAVLALLVPVREADSKDRDSTTPQEVFDGMRESFHAEKAAGVHVRYAFQLTGAHGGNWWIEVNDGKYKMGKGPTDKADVTFIASDNDWVAMSNNKLSGTWAYVTGRLKVRGSQALARKLDEMF